MDNDDETATNSTDVNSDNTQTPPASVEDVSEQLPSETTEEEELGTLGEHSFIETEKGSYNYVTIGITHSPLGANPATGEKIPQWGIGIFFDYQFIPMKFKEPIKNAQGLPYRPEMRFWTREDAIAYAQEISGKFRFKLDKAHFGSAIIPDAPIDQVSQAIEYANNSGLLVNNLFQLRDGTWRCNVRVDFYANFAEHKNPAQAIEEVVDSSNRELRQKYFRERIKP